MKKRNLFIGIALVAIILVALYLANYGSIFEGNTTLGSRNKIVTAANKIVTAPDNKTALKTIEDILSGALKMDGKGKDDLTEYTNDLKEKRCGCVNDKPGDFTYVDVNKIIEKNQISEMATNNMPAPAKLSYNDTFQVIYTFGKVAASNPETGGNFIKQIKPLTPYFYIYGAFTSKLLANINAILTTKDTDSMKALSNILNLYRYSVNEEVTIPPSKVNVSFVSSLSYVREICRRIYQMGTGGWPQTNALMVGYMFFFCNFGGKVPEAGQNKPSLGVLNYTIPNLQEKITEINSNYPPTANRDLAPSDPLFMQRLAGSVEASKDSGNPKIFGPYQNIGGSKHKDFYKTDMEDLKKFLASGSTGNPPVWFNKQPPK